LKIGKKEFFLKKYRYLISGMDKKKLRKEKKKRTPGKRGNPTGKGGFQKGFAPVSLGRPKLSDEEKAVRDATRTQIFNTFHWAANLQSKGQKINENELTMFQKGIYRSVKLFSVTGDYDCIKFCLDHIIGKAPESIKLDATSGGVTLVISNDFIPNFGTGSTDVADKSGQPSKS
jgi:hypothetical protein